MPVRVALLVVGSLVVAVTVRTVESGPGFSFALGVTGRAILLASGIAPALVSLWLWPRRPTVCILLCATGVTWLLAEWDNPAAEPWVFTLGLVSYAVCPAVVTHLAVTYDGRTTHWSSVIVVVGYVITLAVMGAGPALFFVPGPSDCPVCPRNLVGMFSDPSQEASLLGLGVLLGALWTGATSTFLIARLIAASHARLRTTVAVCTCAVLFVGLTCAAYVRGLGAGLLGSGPTDRHIWQGQGVVLLCLAAGVVADELRRRRDQRALTTVVTALGYGGQLRRALADRLGDPALAVAYPVDDGSRFVDETGSQVDLPSDPTRSSTPIARNGVLLAFLIHRPGLSSVDVQELASAVHLPLEHAGLTAAALDQLEELRSSAARVVAAGDAERRRLERDLHDGAQQSLVALKMAAASLGSRIPSDDLITVQYELETAIASLRLLAHGLYPTLLASDGLAIALAALAESRDLTVVEVPSTRLPELLESTIYELVEGIGPRNHSEVNIRCTAQSVAIDLETDEDPGDLSSIADRVAALGGRLRRRIENGTTRISTVLPLDGATNVSTTVGRNVPKDHAHDKHVR